MNHKSVCIIGAGNHATANIYPCVQLLDQEIAAVSTRNLLHSTQALQRFGSSGHAYDNYQEMLEKEDCPDVIVITQAADAPAIVMDCLKQGRHVFTEKPLGLSAAQAQEVYDTAVRYGGDYMVGFMKRYAPAYRQLKQLTENSLLGRVCSFHASFCVNASRFCRNDEDYMYFVAIHYLDLIRYLYGEIKKVTGYSCKNESGTSYALSLLMKSGAAATLDLENRTPWTRETESILTTFEHGFAEARDLERVTIHKSALAEKAPWSYLSEQDSVYSPNMAPLSGTARDLYLRGFVGEMEAFFNHEHSGSMRDNVLTTQFCEKILEVIHKEY